MPRRNIDTAMWGDPAFADLTPGAKLLFFRLVTGDDTTTAGATRAPLRRLASDLGVDMKRAEAALQGLVDAGLVRVYDEGWMWIPRFIAYQLTGPGFAGAARKVARQVPESLGRAITRELDRLIGERPDKVPTKKAASSRQKAVRPQLDPPSNQGQTDVQREREGQDQDRPTGLSVLIPEGDDANAPAAAAPGGAAGANRRGKPGGSVVVKAAGAPAGVEVWFHSEGGLYRQELGADGLTRDERDDIAKYRATGQESFLAEVERYGSPTAQAAAAAARTERAPALRVIEGGGA